MPILCRLFGHSYELPQVIAYDRVFGRIILHECRRCGCREIESKPT